MENIKWNEVINDLTNQINNSFDVEDLLEDLTDEGVKFTKPKREVFKTRLKIYMHIEREEIKELIDDVEKQHDNITEELEATIEEVQDDMNNLLGDNIAEENLIEKFWEQVQRYRNGQINIGDILQTEL